MSWWETTISDKNQCQVEDTLKLFHVSVYLLKIAITYDRTLKNMWNLGKFLELGWWELQTPMWVQNESVHSIGNCERGNAYSVSLEENTSHQEKKKSVLWIIVAQIYAMPHISVVCREKREGVLSSQKG